MNWWRNRFNRFLVGLFIWFCIIMGLIVLYIRSH